MISQLNILQVLSYNLEIKWTLTHHIVHYLSSTIHHYNTIIQIVIFLGVFITRVIGVNRNNGDFFMGVLNILIFQALQTFSGWLLDSHHEHTITQLPGSIWAALSKFDIDTKSIVYSVPKMSLYISSSDIIGRVNSQVPIALHQLSHSQFG